MAILIGLTGRRGVGKDTAFGYIEEWAAERGVSARRRGFADSLKLSFARLFIPNISLDEAVIWCDELKMAPGSGTKSDLLISWGKYDRHGTWTEILHQISGRQALQRYGTEGHRDVFGADFWVDALLPTHSIIDEHDLPVGPAWPWNFRGQLDPEPPDIAVITDTRFENEAKRIRMLKGYVLEVIRDTGNDDGHISEAGLPSDLVDWSIRNESGFDQLRAQARRFCDVMLAPVLGVEPEREWPQPRVP